MTHVPHRLLPVLFGALVWSVAGCGGSSGSSAPQTGTAAANPPPPPSGRAAAFVVGSRSQLVGGERALGEVGDTMMQNEKIRIVIQKEGFSRGFGVYGGSLIDADLRRPSEIGTSGTPVGNDQFSELFPAFFIQAVNVDSVTVLDDGSHGGTARVEASGNAGDFLQLAGFLNRAVTGSNTSTGPCDISNAGNAGSGNGAPQIRYSTIYELAPNTQYVTVRFRVQNLTTGVLKFPQDCAKNLGSLLGLDLKNFKIPMGDIALYGATSKVFIPGVGFDLRFGLERSYQYDVPFPAFPGIVTDFVASRAEGASYGLLAADDDRNYVLDKKEVYSVYDALHVPINRSSMLIPFVASSFVGVFYSRAPDELPPGEGFEVKKYFILGSGDVGSVLDVINQIQGTETGRLGGQVMDATTGASGEGLSVVVYQHFDDGFRRPYSQYDVREDGFFGGTLAAGRYSLKVVGKGRQGTDFVDFDITPGDTTALRVGSTPPGRIFVRILDEHGYALPAKATAIGYYGAEHVGQLTPDFLFDLSAGEEFRSSDLIDDDVNDPHSRGYIESVAYTGDGAAELLVRPGEYEIVSSRGPEYDTMTSRVTVGPAQTATVAHRLRRIVDTTGWMALDAHVHSHASIDSPMNFDERVVSIAAEGIEIPVATDHNFVTDYGPYVARNDLTRWLHPIVGLELTTLESGHFNGYPLRYQVGPITHGSFEWANHTPDQVFDELRNLGRNGPDQTIVQVNHPRDQILGYYTQYSRDALTEDQRRATATDAFVTPTGPAFLYKNGENGCTKAKGCSTFSFNYEVMELLNAKLFGEIHHYRVPELLPPGDLPPVIPPAGSILLDHNRRVAFPGVVDDWFNLLNLGYRYIGVGTGDSHSGFDEAGQFRTMIYLGVDVADSVNDQMVVDALRSRRAVATNGPLIDFWINDPQRGVMGQTIETDDASGKVSLTYTLTSNPAIKVDHLNIYRNGVIAYRLNTCSAAQTDHCLDPGRDLAAHPWEETVVLDLAHNLAGEAIDSWFAIEAIGNDNLHPVIRTLEIPPVVLTDALGSLAGPLGLSSDEFGSLQPPDIFPVTAYAITNPVWVTTHSGEFMPPGLLPSAVLNSADNDPRFQVGIFPTNIVAPRKKVPVLESRLGRVDLPGHRNVPLFYPLGDDAADVRKVMARLGALAHHGGN